MEFILDVLGRIGFEWSMGLFNLVNFLFVFFLLNKFFFPKVLSTLDERQAKIEESLNKFEQSDIELQKAKTEAEKIVNTAKQEGNDVREKASKEAASTSEQIIKNAEQNAEEIISKAKLKIDRDREEMEIELRKEMADVVIDAVEKVVDIKLDETQDRGIVEKMLIRLK